MKAIYILVLCCLCGNLFGQFVATQPNANTPVKFVKVHFHFIRDANGGNNFNDADAKIASMNYIKAANRLLANMPVINLKYNNTVVSTLPSKYRYVLAPDPNDFNDPDADGIYFHNVAGAENFTDTTGANHKDKLFPNLVSSAKVINVFFMRGNTGTGIAGDIFSNHCTVGINIHDVNYVNVGIINHEIAHCLGRNHTWETKFNENCTQVIDLDNRDDCDDTPRNTNCTSLNSFTTETPCSLTGLALCQTQDKLSNNMMDYNAGQNALTPCQLGAIHASLNNSTGFITLSVNNCANNQPIVRNNSMISSDIFNTFSIDIKGNSSISFATQKNIALTANRIDFRSGFHAKATTGKTFTAKSQNGGCNTITLNPDEATWDAYHKDYFGSTVTGTTGIPTGILRLDGTVNTQKFVCGNESNAIANIPNANLGRKEAEEQTQIAKQPEQAKVKEKNCFTIYPNPSFGSIYITSACQDPYNVQIFNSSGSLIHSYSAILKNLMQLPLVGNGIFLVRIQTENEVCLVPK